MRTATGHCARRLKRLQKSLEAGLHIRGAAHHKARGHDDRGHPHGGAHAGYRRARAEDLAAQTANETEQPDDDLTYRPADAEATRPWLHDARLFERMAAHCSVWNDPEPQTGDKSPFGLNILVLAPVCTWHRALHVIAPELPVVSTAVGGAAAPNSSHEGSSGSSSSASEWPSTPGNLGLTSTYKNLDLKWTATQETDVLGLNVLEINQDEIRYQGVSYHGESIHDF